MQNQPTNATKPSPPFTVEVRPQCGNLRLSNLYYANQSRAEVHLTIDEVRGLLTALGAHGGTIAHTCGFHQACDPRACEHAPARRDRDRAIASENPSS